MSGTPCTTVVRSPAASTTCKVGGEIGRSSNLTGGPWQSMPRDRTGGSDSTKGGSGGSDGGGGRLLWKAKGRSEMLAYCRGRGRPRARAGEARALGRSRALTRALSLSHASGCTDGGTAQHDA